MTLLSYAMVTPTATTPSAATSTNWSHADLQQINDEKALTLVPAMVVFGLYIVVGVTGNSLVCYVMGFKLKMNTQNLLIVYLAVFDLLSCLISMPTDIYDMRYLYIFPSETACKIFRTITAFTTVGSILTLSIIAVDRYWKICRRTTYTMNIRKVKLSLIVVVSVAAAISWPTYFIFGIRTIESGIPGFPGHDCSTSDAVKDTVYPLVYLSTLFVLFIVFCVFLAILYSCILVKTKNHRRLMSSKLIPMRYSSSSLYQRNLSSSGNNLNFTSISGQLNSSRQSGLQKERVEDEEMVTDFSSTSGNDNDQNEKSSEKSGGVVINNIIGAGSFMIAIAQQIPQSSGLEDCQRNDNDYGMRSTEDGNYPGKDDSGDNNCDGNSKNTVEYLDCLKRDNGDIISDNVLKNALDKDNQKQGYSNNDDCDPTTRGVVDKDRMKSVNDNHHSDFGRTSENNGVCRKLDDNVDNGCSCSVGGVKYTDFSRKENGTKSENDCGSDNQNVQCGYSYTRKTSSTAVSVNSRSSIINHEAPIGVSNVIRGSKDNVLTESSYEMQLVSKNNTGSTKTLVDSARHTPSPKLVQKFGPKRKISNSSLVYIYNNDNNNERDNRRRKSSSATSKLDHKTTIIAFIVTLVFILSFLPYLCLQIAKVNIEGLDYNLSGAALVFFNISLRSYYINSITNPFIYGVYNTHFRHQLGILWSRVRRKCKRRDSHTRGENGDK